jgi:hypothetical protein
MKRREFVKIGLLSAPSLMLAQSQPAHSDGLLVAPGPIVLTRHIHWDSPKFSSRLPRLTQAVECSSWSMTTLRKEDRIAICIRRRMNGCMPWKESSG